MNQLKKQSVILLPADPETQRGQQAGYISWARWFYPTMIMFSMLAALLVTFLFTDAGVRPEVIMWFLFVCPGMIVVRFFQVQDVLLEWLLAFALSVAIDAFIAGGLLYAGRWSPLAILWILISFCLAGVLLLIAMSLKSTRDRGVEA